MGVPSANRRKLSISILDRLGLSDRMTHRPADLSGGEQQRVAVARALVKSPDILFADEPTGNLDQENARQLVELFRELNRDGLTIVMVTHNLETARAKRAPGYPDELRQSTGRNPGRSRGPRMILRDLISISAGNLSRMKLRTILTISGVVVAIGTFVAMLSFGAGNQRYVTEQLRPSGYFTPCRYIRWRRRPRRMNGLQFSIRRRWTDFQRFRAYDLRSRLTPSRAGNCR